MNNIDRRVSLRMPFVAKAICADDHGRNHYGIIRDINTFGVYIEMMDSPVACDRCELIIVIEGNYSKLTFEKFSGEVVRKDKDGIAIKFDYKFEWLPLVPLLHHKILAKRREKLSD